MIMLTMQTFNKILVPFDGSVNSIRGLKFALAIAKQSGSSIIGLNVFSPPLFVKTSSIRMNEAKHKSGEIIAQAKSISQKAGVIFSGVTKVGNNVGSTIVNFAQRKKVNMIIIGSHGTDPEFGLFLGSIANYVVNKSKIPVTIVK